MSVAGCANPLAVTAAAGREIDTRCDICHLRHKRDRRGHWSVIGPLQVVLFNEDLVHRGVATRVLFGLTQIRIQFDDEPGPLKRALLEDLVALRPPVQEFARPNVGEATPRWGRL